MKKLLLMLMLTAVPAHAGDNLKAQLWGGNQPIWGHHNNNDYPPPSWGSRAHRKYYQRSRDHYDDEPQVIIVVPRPQTCYRSTNNPTVTVCVDN